MSGLIRGVVLTAVTMLAAACGPGIAGSGIVVNETRSVPEWNALSVQDGLPVSMTLGSRSVLVQADDNLLPYLETFVDHGVLIVRHRPGVTLFSSRVQVVLSNDALTGLTVSGGSPVSAEASATSNFPLDVSGGSTVVVDQVSASSLVLNASGGSTLTVTGAATSSTFDVSGGSRVFARSIASQIADVEVSGGSHLALTVTDHISGNASGGSTVTIYGQPTGHVSASGGSNINWMNQ